MNSENILQWIQSYGLIVLFVGNILDHSGLPLFILVAGGMTALGVHSIDSVFVVSFISVLTGDLLFFLIGRRFNRNHFLGLLKFRIIRGSVLKYELNILERPLIFIVFGRLIAIVGKYIPVVLGLNRYNVKRFIIFDVIGCFIYSSFFLAIGYYGGSVFSDNIRLLHKSFIIISLALIYYLLRRVTLATECDDLGVVARDGFWGSVKAYNKEGQAHPTPNRSSEDKGKPKE
jgi:membrane protein DedA with SNARE-associated domain